MGSVNLDRWRQSDFHIAAYFILIVSVFLAYANIYANDFVYDDTFLIVHNDFLRHWDWHIFSTNLFASSNLITGYYRPLQTLLYVIVFQIAGLSPVAFHSLNLILHAVNACLVYCLGRRLGFNLWGCFLASLLWALHPVHTEAVTYMSATADTLYSFFSLIGILILFPDFTPKRIVYAIPFMLFALLSKESAVSFPFLAVSCFYFMRTDRLNLKIYWRFWPLLLITAIFVICHFLLLSTNATAPHPGPTTATSDFSFYARIPRYLGFLLAPTHLHMGHEISSYGTIFHFSVLTGIILSILCIVQILRERLFYTLPLSWGLCWCFAALFPSVVGEGIFYEHWLYLPSVGLFLGIAQMTALSLKKIPIKHISILLSVSVLILASTEAFLTYRQNETWNDPISFYNNIFAANEPAAKAHVNLGILYAERGQYDKELEQTEIAVKNSKDTLAVAQYNWGVALLNLSSSDSNKEEALLHMRRALEIDPDYYPALNSAARLCSEEGNTADADLYRARADQVAHQLHN